MSEQDLTPVDIRLGPVDLEMLDELITSGTAASRAEAVGWVLARIRERPAYAQSPLLTPADWRADAVGVVAGSRSSGR